jgi:hypothetical protein
LRSNTSCSSGRQEISEGPADISDYEAAPDDKSRSSCVLVFCVPANFKLDHNISSASLGHENRPFTRLLSRRWGPRRKPAWGVSMFRVSRMFFWTIRIAPLLAFLLLGTVAQILPSPLGEGIAGFFAFAFVGWVFVGGYAALWLTPLFVSTISCPGCQEDIDPVDVWACGCGYKDHRERHVLSFKCPKCKNRIGHFDCPRCSATILI